jgi:hypothetical protein
VIGLKNLKVLNTSVGRGWGRLELRVSDGINRLTVSGFNLADRFEEVGSVVDLAVTFEREYNIYDSVWRLTDFKESSQTQ